MNTEQAWIRELMSLFQSGPDRDLIRDVITAGKALGSPTARVAVLEAMKESLGTWRQHQEPPHD